MKNPYMNIDNIHNLSEPTSSIEDLPEAKLWRNVLLRAVIDTADRNFRISQEAREFIDSNDVFEIMDLAFIDRKWIYKIRQFVSEGKVVRLEQKKAWMELWEVRLKLKEPWMELWEVSTPITDKFVGGYRTDTE